MSTGNLSTPSETAVRTWIGRVISLGSSATSISITVATGTLLIALLADLCREVVIFEPFKVATTLEGAPVDSPLLSEPLLRDMRTIVRQAETGYNATPLRPQGNDRLATIQVPSELGTIRTLMVALRDVLGRSPTRVHAAAVHTPVDSLKVWVVSLRVERATQLGGDWVFEHSAPTLKDAVTAVAYPLLDQLDPFVVSMHRYRTLPRDAWDAEIVPRLWRMVRYGAYQ